MEVIEAIKSRRSIREFFPTPVPHELIVQVLESGIWAPSTKNLQPWRFVVLGGNTKDQIATILGEVGVRMLEDADPLERVRARSVKRSARVIRQAPVLITVWNTAPVTRGEAVVMGDPNPGRLLGWSVELQSIAAAIENMLLTAHGLGLGGLWNCDLNHASAEVKRYMSAKDDLVAGVVLGYCREVPVPPPRHSLEQVVTWVGDI
jgi:nitroreductase